MEDDAEEADILETAAYSTTSISYEHIRLLKLPNGMLYFGQTGVLNDLPEGFGVATYEDNAFIGEWNAERLGNTIHTTYGTIVNGNTGSRYEGEIELSLGELPQYKGIGQIVFQNGSVRCGYFDENSLEGLGIEIDTTENQIYVGEFAKDRFQGQGMCYYGTGDTYSGEFSKGFREGYGEYSSFSGNKCECRCGRWARDGLVSSEDNTVAHISKVLEEAGEVAAKALKVYEEFNTRISRIVASSRAKLIKMMLYFADSNMHQDPEIQAFLKVIVKKKLYFNNVLPSLTNMTDIRLKIQESIARREEMKTIDVILPSPSTEKTEPKRTVEKQTRTKLDLEEVRSRIPYTNEEKFVEESIKSVTEPVLPHREPPTPYLDPVDFVSLPTARSFVSDDSESEVVVEDQLNDEALEKELEVYSKSETSRIADERNNSVSGLSHQSFEDMSLKNSESSNAAILNLHGLKTSTLINETLQQTVKEGIPRKPYISENESTTQQYFSIPKPKQNFPKDSKVLTPLKSKLTGVRRFISAKFHSQQQEIKRHTGGVAVNNDQPSWLDIYTEAAEETNRSQLSHSPAAIDAKGADLLQKTLQKGLEEQDIETDSLFNFDSISQANFQAVSNSGREAFQTTELVADEFKNSLQAQAKAPLPPPAPPTHKLSTDQLNINQHQYTERQSSSRKEETSRTGYQYSTEHQKMVRLVFLKAPLPKPPREHFPVPPSYQPKPPSIAPPPPSIDPRPPKRPPYPPPPI